MTEMNLPNSIDSLESVDTKYQGFYSKGDDGKYAINPTSIIDGYIAKTKALDSERKSRSDREKELNEFKSKYSNIDLSSIEDLKQKQQEWESEKEKREQESLEAKGQYDAVLKKIKDGHVKDIDTHKKQAMSLEQQIKELNSKYEQSESDKKNYILDDKIKSSALKSGVFAEDVNDVLILTKKHFDLDENHNISVKDEDGTVMHETTIDKFFSEHFKSKKPKFYVGSNASGSGAVARNGNLLNNSESERTPVQKIADGLKK